MTAGRPRARRSLAVAALASTLLAIVAAGGGCEVAIGDTVPAFACVPGPDVCPAGQVCYRNQCIPSCVMAGCKAAGEVCNQSTGLCGTASGTDGGGPEVGVNDSGGPDAVDVVDSQPPDDEAAPPMEVGPDVTNPCPGTNNEVLCGCSGNSACKSNLCVDQLAVGSGLYQAAGSMNFCSTPCCTSSDCPQTPVATVCYATGQGGNYCVNPAWIGRTGGSGSGEGGSPCSMSRQCRSGLCDGTQCLDTCCSTGQSSAQCSGGDVCTLGNFPGATAIDKNTVFYCGSGGSGTGGSSCTFPSDCQSNLCASATMTGSNRCWNACRNSADCSSSYSCNYVIPPMTMTNPAPVVGACFPTQGSLSMGQTCDPANDMCKGFCDSTTNKCTDVCFTDSDCSGTVSGWRCRDESIAVSGGGSYSVLCCGS